MTETDETELALKSANKNEMLGQNGEDIQSEQFCFGTSWEAIQSERIVIHNNKQQRHMQS